MGTRCPFPDGATVCLAPSLGEGGFVAVHLKQKTSMNQAEGLQGILISFLSPAFSFPLCPLLLLLLLLLKATEQLAVQDPWDSFLWPTRALSTEALGSIS